MDLDKVIKGLECCANRNSCIGKCPYDELGDIYDCVPHLAADALALLKAQEPRVMTLEEVKQAEGRDVWLELSGNIADDVLTAATIEGCGTKGLSTRYESLPYTKYGVKPYGWRCWDSRPTDEQRKAVEWEP